MSGQSGRRSRSSKRRLVKNSEIFDTVSAVCACDAPKLLVGARLLLEFAAGTRADLMRERREFWGAAMAFCVPWC